MALAPFFVLGPVVAKRFLGGVTGWATIATAYAAGAVLGGLFGLRWRPQRPMLAGSMAVLALAPLIAGALLFVPLGYAVAGPVAARIGVGATLWVGAVWVVVSTAVLLTVRGIRTLRRRDASEIVRSTSTAR
jgi:hypothetical protein